MTFDVDMIKALEDDGKYLKALTGRDHGPWTLAFLYFDEEDELDEDFDDYNYNEDYPNEDDLMEDDQ